MPAAGVELFTAYYRRFHPHIAAMRKLLMDGAIGRPLLAQIDYAQPHRPDAAWGGGWRVLPEISGGGLFVDVVSHRLDAMVSLLGPPAGILGIHDTFLPGSMVDDAVALLIRFEEGSLCSVTGDFVSGRSADRFLIAGTDGTINSDQLDSHAFTLDRRGKVETFTFEQFPAPHLGLIRHVERVLENEEDNACSGSDGRWTDWILDLGLHRVSK